MKMRITFDDDELKSALKKHFKIKGTIAFWHIRSIFKNGHIIEYTDNCTLEEIKAHKHHVFNTSYIRRRSGK